MTTEQKRQAIKSGLVIVFGVLMLLSAFGPLAAYKDWLLMAAGVVSIVASAVFGVELQTPAAQVRNIQDTRAMSRNVERIELPADPTSKWRG